MAIQDENTVVKVTEYVTVDNLDDTAQPVFDFTDLKLINAGDPTNEVSPEGYAFVELQTDFNEIQNEPQETNEQNKDESSVTNAYKGKRKKMKQETKPVDLSKLKDVQDSWRENALKAVSRPFGKNANITALLANNKATDKIDPAGDGVTHINATLVGKTKLGKSLDLAAYSNFNHPDLGKFATLFGLWYWLCGERLEKFRTLYGRNLKEASKDIKLNKIKGFYKIMAEATWYKVIQNNTIINLMVNSVDLNGKPLPFKSYYFQGDQGIPVIHKTSDWYVPILEEIRRVLIINDKLINAKKEAGEEVDTEDLAVPNFSFCK